MRVTKGSGMNKNAPLPQCSFSIENGEAFRGYDLGDTWNGWRMPAFPFAEAQKVAEACSINYDAKLDAFIFDYDKDYDPEVYSSKEYQTVDGTKKLYAIGAGCWVWEKATAKGPE
jgi:hypothetical protein